MKVYLLYDNPYDEGDNVYGVFSTRGKANRARKALCKVSKHELYIREVEVDELEWHAERANSEYQWYFSTKLYHSLPYTWDFSPNGLDTFLNYERGAYVADTGRMVSAMIWANSEKQAEEIANKMVENGEVFKWNQS